jgi:hypothetical protein
MEELLNKLIKKWWKPFWWDDKLSSLHKEFGVWKWYIRFHNWMDSELFDLRQLTSKESWLWQFVCENGMIKEQKEEKLIEVYDNLRWRTETVYDDEKYEFRLIESALCNEDKLDQFLLDNIKIS